MKNNSLLRFFLFSLMFWSCNKQLNLLPTDSIPPDKAFITVADLQKGLEGVYELNSGSLNKVYIGSILADEVNMNATTNPHGQLGFEWQYTPDDAAAETEFLSDFSGYYSMIDAINKELASMGNVTPKNNTGTLLKKRINAELISLRGIAHFELLTRFMSAGYDANSPGVPIMLQSDLLGKPARAKVGQVIAQINKDLAAGMADAALPDAPDNVTRLSHATIAAYQARVSLLTRDWTNAVLFARQALVLSGKTLADNTNFKNYWQDSSEVETLWKYRNQVTPQSFWAAGGELFFTASNKLIKEFDKNGNDIRYSVYFKPSVSAGNDTTYLINKYSGSGTSPYNDVKLVRVAELYLDMAEGFANQATLPGFLDSAKHYLNQLREKRISSNPDTSLTTLNAIQAVSDERFRELCFEGFRFFDLKRNGFAINRDLTDVQSTLWLTLPANDHRFALPIPEHEILANPNMVQNPGY